MSHPLPHIPTHIGPFSVRSLVHALLALGIATTALHVPPLWFYGVVLGLTCAFAWTRRHHYLVALHDRTHTSYGEFFFVAGVLLSYVFFADTAHAWYVALLTLALADPLAAFVGNRYGKRAYRIAGERRTVEGTVTCILVTSCIGMWAGVPVTSALAGGLVIGFIENVSIRGSDNMTVPVFAGLMALLAL